MRRFSAHAALIGQHFGQASRLPQENRQLNPQERRQRIHSCPLELCHSRRRRRLIAPLVRFPPQSAGRPAHPPPPRFRIAGFVRLEHQLPESPFTIQPLFPAFIWFGFGPLLEFGPCVGLKLPLQAFDGLESQESWRTKHLVKPVGVIEDIMARRIFVVVWRRLVGSFDRVFHVPFYARNTVRWNTVRSNTGRFRPPGVPCGIPSGGQHGVRLLRSRQQSVGCIHPAGL